LLLPNKGITTICPKDEIGSNGAIIAFTPDPLIDPQ